MTTRNRVLTAVLTGAALLAAPALVSSLRLEARAAASGASAEIRGSAKDMEGNPLAGVEVQMIQIDSAAKPFVTKTRKDGTFVFPFLPYHSVGREHGLNDKPNYTVQFASEGLNVAKVHIVSRAPQSVADKGEGQKFQDDEGTVKPGGKLPPVFVKPGGTVHIDVSMASQAYFAEKAAAQAASAVSAPTAAAGTPPAQMSTDDQARLLATQGKYDEAISEMEKSIQQSATGAKWLDLGRMKLHTQDNDGAKAAFARASGLDASLRGPHFLLGKLLNDEGKTPEAIGEMEKELALDPADPATLKALGTLYHNAGRKADAIGALEKVVAAEPDAESLAQLAGLYAEQGNFTRSEELYRKILDMNPGQADVVYVKIGRSVMSQANVGTEERKRAADAFQRAIQANPSNARAHIELAYVLLGLGDIPKAKEEMKRYLELDPNAKDATEVRNQLKDLS